MKSKSHTTHADAGAAVENTSDVFSSLCPPNSANIVLEYKNSETLNYDPITSPTGETIYRLDLDEGEVRRHSNGHLVGSWTEHTWHSEKLKFKFPWEGGKWGFDPDDSSWLSDVGTLKDHEFKWREVNNKSDEVSVNDDSDEEEKKVKFSITCADVSDPMERVICAVTMSSYNGAKFTIPKDVVKNWDQLDEMFVVAVAVMSRAREEIKDDMDSEQRSKRDRRR